MSKRGNGEGSIYQRSDGRWVACLTLDDGGRRSFYAPTRAEAAEKLKTVLAAQQRGETLVASSASVEAWALEWLEARRAKLRPGGWRKHNERMRRHIIPAIGRTPLGKLAPERLDRLYADKLGEGLSPQTVRHIHSTIHACLELALRRGKVLRNIADLVEAPDVTPHEMTTLTEDEYLALLAAATADPLYGSFFIVDARTGMRKSEVLGLRWRDVDLDRREIHLRSVLERARGEISFPRPKTKKSQRNIMLTKDAVDALRRRRTDQLEQRLAAGAAWVDHGLVFTREDGQPLADSTLRRRFNALLKTACISQIRIHDLRHTLPTLLLGRGVPMKITSEMLGHARTSITEDLYSHVTPTMQRDAVSVLEAIGAGR